MSVDLSLSRRQLDSRLTILNSPFRLQNVVADENVQPCLGSSSQISEPNHDSRLRNDLEVLVNHTSPELLDHSRYPRHGLVDAMLMYEMNISGTIKS